MSAVDQNEFDQNRVIAALQIYILSKNIKPPQELDNPNFMKVLIQNVLEISVENLTKEKINELTEFVSQEVRNFKQNSAGTASVHQHLIPYLKEKILELKSSDETDESSKNPVKLQSKKKLNKKDLRSISISPDSSINCTSSISEKDSKPTESPDNAVPKLKILRIILHDISKTVPSVTVGQTESCLSTRKQIESQGVHIRDIPALKTPIIVLNNVEQVMSIETNSTKENTVSTDKEKCIPNDVAKKRKLHKTVKSRVKVPPPSCSIEQLLTTKNSKDMGLRIDANPKQIYGSYYMLDTTKYQLTIGDGLLPDKVVDYKPSIEELLYWPGVEFKLSLPELVITRRCIGNIEYELVQAQSTDIKDSNCMNNQNIQRFYANETVHYNSLNDENIELSQALIVLYLELILKCLEVSRFEQKIELKIVLQTILADLNGLKRISLYNKYSYFLSSRPYYRIFKQDVEISQNHELLVLREVCNPEIMFCIKRCGFREKRKAPFQGDSFKNYFEKILIDKSATAINEFEEMLQKNYSILCIECINTKKFRGPTKQLDVFNHLGGYYSNKYLCTNCDYKSDMMNLSKERWCHICRTNKN